MAKLLFLLDTETPSKGAVVVTTAGTHAGTSATPPAPCAAQVLAVIPDETGAPQTVVSAEVPFYGDAAQIETAAFNGLRVVEGVVTGDNVELHRDGYGGPSLGTFQFVPQQPPAPPAAPDYLTPLRSAHTQAQQLADAIAAALPPQ